MYRVHRSLLFVGDTTADDCDNYVQLPRFLWTRSGTIISATPFWSASGSGGPLRPDFAADDIRVDTVGVGGDADDVLLEDIASVTGGQFRNLNEGFGSFFLLSRLADWYKSVDEDVRGEQRFYYAEGFPRGVDYFRVGYFDVEPSLDWMTVAFHANEDNAAIVQLAEPGGSAPIVITPPTVTLREDPKHSVYRIRTPKSGRWMYRVDVRKPSAEFFAVASALTSLTAKIGPKQLTRRPSGDFLMPIRVWIADRASVRGATVTGYVRRPDGVKTAVTLVDDGLSMDGGANDGIYGLGFAATIPGAYYIQLKATGTSNTGVPFERYPWTSFVLPGQPKRPIQPGEGGEVPPTPPISGAVTPYLVGTFDLRDGGRTRLHILNPTARNLRVWVAFFDDKEKPLTCVRKKLTGNDLLEIDAFEHIRQPILGLVKVVALHEKESVPELGIVGNQRQIFTTQGFFFKKQKMTETGLHPVPEEILLEDLKNIRPICQ